MRRASLALLLCCLLPACSHGGGDAASTTAAAPPPPALTVYAALPYHGAARAETGSMLRAMRLALAQSDGLAGTFRVRVRRLETHETPDTCDAAARTAVADRRAVAVVGTYSSACTAAMLGVLAPAGLPLISPVNSAVDLAAIARDAAPTAPAFARVAVDDDVRGAAAAALAVRLDAKRLYVVDDGTPGSTALAAAAIRQARAQGIAVAGRSRLRSGEAGAIAVDAIATAADAVYYSGAPGEEAARLWRALRTATGADPGALRLIGSEALFSDEWLRTAGSAADGSYVLSGALPADRVTGRGAGFVGAYTRLHGEPSTYTVYAAEALDVALDAIRRSDGTRAGVRQAVVGTRGYDGLLGRFSFDADGNTTLRRVAVLRVGDGRFRFDRALDVPPAAGAS